MSAFSGNLHKAKPPRVFFSGAACLVDKNFELSKTKFFKRFKLATEWKGAPVYTGAREEERLELCHHRLHSAGLSANDMPATIVTGKSWPCHLNDWDLMVIPKHQQRLTNNLNMTFSSGFSVWDRGNLQG
jgi:hypothetical protein